MRHTQALALSLELFGLVYTFRCVHMKIFPHLREKQRKLTSHHQSSIFHARLECVCGHSELTIDSYRVRRNCCGDFLNSCSPLKVHIISATIYNLWPIFFRVVFIQCSIVVKRIFVLIFEAHDEKKLNMS
jgi:hypothetical protein